MDAKSIRHPDPRGELIAASEAADDRRDATVADQAIISGISREAPDGAELMKQARCRADAMHAAARPLRGEPGARRHRRRPAEISALIAGVRPIETRPE